jgi:hypothetical protein
MHVYIFSLSSLFSLACDTIGVCSTTFVSKNKASSFYVFFYLTKNYFKYIKIICMKLTLFKSAFQYESNGANYK